jgi:FXSXX-COOH protein
MSEPPRDKETIFVDVSRLDLEALLQSPESPLLESIRRIATEADGDAIAGFADGIS